MSKIEEAQSILSDLQVPQQQRSSICCLSLLALAQITESSQWTKTKNDWIRIHDIIEFARTHYDKDYAENSRETFRKQAIHHFRNAAFIEDNGLATNSPNYRYRLTDEMQKLLRSYGKTTWAKNIKRFFKTHESLIDKYAQKRTSKRVSATVNGEILTFSAGAHNVLQKEILESFAAHFAPDSICLYVGDTANKDLYLDTKTLEEIGITITQHDKMPDVVLYSKSKQWLYFIEAVTSVGPMTPKRISEIQAMLPSPEAKAIYITAFLDFKTYKRFAKEIAWETEVWIAAIPEHMIHLNGDRFIGPR
ncbi:MAG: BsuBI/PstI family type II restriction endonuclease [Akkermansia sp.]